MVKLKIDNYVVNHQIGIGSSSVIYKSTDINNPNIKRSIKLMLKKNKSNNQLFLEAKILKLLSNNIGFPTFEKYDETDDFFYIIFESLGPSLMDLYKQCSFKFSLKTVLLLSFQVIDRIETLHSYNIVHRDINPSNFLIGINEKRYILYLLDFDLSSKYKDSKTNLHIKNKTARNKIGTIGFASINTHINKEYSRRDDLESIGYMLIFLLKGLPWVNNDELLQNNTINNVDTYEQNISDAKLNTPLETLCDGLPDEFLQYLKYVKNLKFEENPDYSYLKNLFKVLYTKRYKEIDNIFDWDYLNNKIILKNN